MFRISTNSGCIIRLVTKCTCANTQGAELGGNKFWLYSLVTKYTYANIQGGWIWGTRHKLKSSDSRPPWWLTGSVLVRKGKAQKKKKNLCVYICMGCSCEDATWRGETQRLLWSAPGQWDGPSENYNDALAYEQAGSRECRTKMLWQSVAAAASSLCIWTMGRGIHKRDDVLHSLFPTKENADAEWIMRALGKELFIPYAKEW